MYERLNKLNVKLEPTGKATPADVKELEKSLGVKFGSEYKAFLLEFGSLEVMSLEYYGYTKDPLSNMDVAHVTKDHRESVKDFPNPGDFVVFKDGGDGSVYCVDSKNMVYRCIYNRCSKANVTFKDFIYQNISGLLKLKTNYSKIINDKVFGRMGYAYAWEKEDSLYIFDKSYPVKVVAQAYKGDGIQQVQRDNYSGYRNFLDIHEDEIKIKLQKYCKDVLKSNKQLEDILTPTTLTFEKDGSWGVLFDSSLDVENGVAFFIKDNEIKVDIQSEFL